MALVVEALFTNKLAANKLVEVLLLKKALAENRFDEVALFENRLKK